MKQVTVLIFTLYLIGHSVAMQGGQPAVLNEFPYMVSIRNSLNQHICGGTIIGPTWILTSSICYGRSWFGYIRYGSNLNDDNDQLPVNKSLNIINVNNSVLNPWANDKQPFDHDCLLINLNEPIPFSDTVYPVTLPVLDQEWPENRTATILGWGKPQDWFGQTELQKAEVPLFSDQFCEEYSYDGWQLPDIAVMKCGGVVNSTYHCYSDYGGPLIVDDIQYGILSFVFSRDGSECGQYLSIYSPVSYFRKWIQQTTGI